MLEQLDGIEERYLELEQLLSNPAVVKNRELYPKYVREHSDLGKIVSKFRGYKQILSELKNSKELLYDSDPEIKELARKDVDMLTDQREILEQELNRR